MAGEEKTTPAAEPAPQVSPEQAALDAALKIEPPGGPAPADPSPTEAAPTEAAPSEQEAPPAEEPAEPADPTEQRMSARLAELARQDRLLRQQKQQMSAEREQLRADLEEAKAIKAQLAEMRAKAAADPLGHLKEVAGLDFYDVLQKLDPSQQQPQQKNDPVSRELAELRSELSAMRKERQEAEQREQAARAQYMEQQQRGAAFSVIGRALAEKGAEYRDVLEQGANGVARVFDDLSTYYENLKAHLGYDPGAPSPDDIRHIAAITQKAIREEKLANLRAVGVETGEPTTQVAVPQAKAPAASQPSPATTLTNRLQGTAPQQRKLLSDAEREAAAMNIPFPFDVQKSGG